MNRTRNAGTFGPSRSQTFSNEQQPKPTNAQIIAELTRAKCVFQLAALLVAMGITEKEQTND